MDMKSGPDYMLLPHDAQKMLCIVPRLQDSVSQPLASYDPYNADREPPSADDAYIYTIADTSADPELQVQLSCLRNDAWRDSITLQGIANNVECED